ncbi:MAG: ribosome silencing factor [Alloprevotella sp.]|nr:ribosome silencing factor [Alloprevotella sp.]
MTPTEKLVDSLVRGMQEKKAFDIITIDLRNTPSAPAQFFVICSGNTPTQVDAIAGSASDFARKELAEKPTSVAGLRNAEWIAFDYGTVMVHVFIPQKREYYDIESLWNDGIFHEIPNLD